MNYKKRLFVKISIVEFWIGVNIIGLPIFHKHEFAVYATQKQ